MIAIGVDPGSVKMGYGVVRLERGRLTYVTCGVLSAPAGWPVWKRLLELDGDLDDVVRDVLRTYCSSDTLTTVVCGIEAGFVQGQMGALTSGAARGVAMVALGRAFGDVRTYAPATVKKSATGSGRASKESLELMVTRRLGMRLAPGPDQADALAVAICRALDT